MIIDEEVISQAVAAYPTPFYLYDEAAIRERAALLSTTLEQAGVPGFKNYFAVKALPNPHILNILKDCGMGADCSSLAELVIAERVGLTGDQIMFTSNNTSDEEFANAAKLGAIINFDDISMVAPYIEKYGAPNVACCRYNPGDISFEGAKESIIGKPSEAKFGMPTKDLQKAYELLQAAGTKRFGLHTMLLSNDLDWHDHEKIAGLLFSSAKNLHDQLGIDFEFVNLGGGIGVPYHPDEQAFDLGKFAEAISKQYEASNLRDCGKPAVYMENGRYITAEAGWLVTKVINIKDTHKKYLGVNASMSNLMRPGMYGAYHHISILGKSDKADEEQVDVVGSLCENNDKFAVNRILPRVAVGDTVVIHTTGAHGHAMGFQYNGKLRSAEILYTKDGEFKQIRRAETIDDYLATVETVEKEKN